MSKPSQPTAFNLFNHASSQFYRFRMQKLVWTTVSMEAMASENIKKYNVNNVYYMRPRDRHVRVASPFLLPWKSDPCCFPR